MIQMSICTKHDNNTHMILFPDFSATGIWCAKCGIGFSNPQAVWPLLPDDLMDLVQVWVWTWEFANVDEHVNHEAIAKVFENSGKHLVHLLNAYTKCELGNIRLKYIRDDYVD